MRGLVATIITKFDIIREGGVRTPRDLGDTQRNTSMMDLNRITSANAPWPPTPEARSKIVDCQAKPVDLI